MREEMSERKDRKKKKRRKKRKESQRIFWLSSPSSLIFLQDGEGFEVLNKHIAAENDFVNNVAQFIHQKAALDADYAKGLSKLSKSFASSGKDELG